DEATLRINLFFYRFGTACLGLALLVSWASTRLWDEATLRINLFFYRFGTACLGLALLVSWASTRL
ncbi:hypothetical protein KJ045_18890, partial [Pseudomonas aeruginosa]|nr:hypothetical protein [Pseudomonas aeruginosa]